MEEEQQLKCSKRGKELAIEVYNLTGLISALYLLVKITPEVLGFSDPLVSTYAQKNSIVRLIFGISELFFLIECLYHMLGW